MARYFGYRRYRRYKKYRRFYRRYGRGRSYARKYVNASSRSNVRMKTTVTHNVTATAGYGDSATGAVINTVMPLEASASNGFSAANSPLYRTYCSLYEECKVVGLKVQLAVASQIGGADIPSLQIYTAWDRKHGYGEPAFSVQDIKDSSTSTIATALNNNVAKLARSCYASDLIEKATWFDSSLDSANTYRNQAWTAAGLNPNMFCPALFIFYNCPSLGETKTVSVSYSVTYYFAFRNPRFGAGGAAKDMPAKAVSVPDAPVNVADMIEDDDGYGSGPNDMTVDEMRAQYDAAVDELEKRRAALKSKRAATSSRQPVTKTV